MGHIDMSYYSYINILIIHKKHLYLYDKFPYVCCFLMTKDVSGLSNYSSVDCKQFSKK